MTAQIQNLGEAVESRGFRGGDGKVRFLYIGQLIQRKQVPVLIAAFQKMHSEFPESELTIIGGGEEEAYCRQLASATNLGEAVRFAGLIRDYPFDQLRFSDVFVSASESESFGLVFTEAMCMGLPVIACRVGGIPEVVVDRETGLLVPPNDIDSLAAAMLEVARHMELRNSLGNAGYRRVKEHFDLSDKVDVILNVFAQEASA
jgi:glycosyltransferase involved in cell wall biosynthesis